MEKLPIDTKNIIQGFVNNLNKLIGKRIKNNIIRFICMRRLKKIQIQIL